MLTASVIRLLRVASFVICAIVVVWFLIFAVNQTDSASRTQQQAVLATSGEPAPAARPEHEGPVRRTIDDAAGGITSPFSALTSGTSSEWATRGAKLLLTLVVYGFGLGYLARVLRVRV